MKEEPDLSKSTNPNCLAIFRGRGGDVEEADHARKTLEIGKSYTVIGGEQGSFATYLKLEGIEGYWNAVLFDCNIRACPINWMARPLTGPAGS